MLKIRSDQLRAIGESLLYLFEERLTADITGDFPAQCEAIGPPETLSAVRYLVKRGRAHGFQSERHISQYVYLGFTFGKDFDVDKELPWARAALRAPGTPEARMERLYEVAQTNEHLGLGLLSARL
jgi:hypothetical protein